MPESTNDVWALQPRNLYGANKRWFYFIEKDVMLMYAFVNIVTFNDLILLVIISKGCLLNQVEEEMGNGLNVVHLGMAVKIKCWCMNMCIS